MELACFLCCPTTVSDLKKIVAITTPALLLEAFFTTHALSRQIVKYVTVCPSDYTVSQTVALPDLTSYCWSEQDLETDTCNISAIFEAIAFR